MAPPWRAPVLNRVEVDDGQERERGLRRAGQGRRQAGLRRVRGDQPGCGGAPLRQPAPHRVRVWLVLQPGAAVLAQAALGLADRLVVAALGRQRPAEGQPVEGLLLEPQRLAQVCLRPRRVAESEQDLPKVPCT